MSQSVLNAMSGNSFVYRKRNFEWCFYEDLPPLLSSEKVVVVVVENISSSYVIMCVCVSQAC
jgi:hypothetical protein